MTKHLLCEFDLNLCTYFICLSFIWFYLGTLKSKCVLPIEETKYEWIKRQKLGKNGVNIVISDFVDVNGCKFCSEVIGLNYTYYGGDEKLTKIDV